MTADAAELFNTYTVDEVRQRLTNVRVEIRNKQLELRKELGDRYNDLVSSCDLVVEMGENCRAKCSGLAAPIPRSGPSAAALRGVKERRVRALLLVAAQARQLVSASLDDNKYQDAAIVCLRARAALAQCATEIGGAEEETLWASWRRLDTAVSVLPSVVLSAARADLCLHSIGAAVLLEGRPFLDVVTDFLRQKERDIFSTVQAQCKDGVKGGIEECLAVCVGMVTELQRVLQLLREAESDNVVLKKLREAQFKTECTDLSVIRTSWLRSAMDGVVSSTEALFKHLHKSEEVLQIKAEVNKLFSEASTKDSVREWEARVNQVVDARCQELIKSNAEGIKKASREAIRALCATPPEGPHAELSRIKDQLKEFLLDASELMNMERQKKSGSATEEMVYGEVVSILHAALEEFTRHTPKSVAFSVLCQQWAGAFEELLQSFRTATPPTALWPRESVGKYFTGMHCCYEEGMAGWRSEVKDYFGNKIESYLSETYWGPDIKKYRLIHSNNLSSRGKRLDISGEAPKNLIFVLPHQTSSLIFVLLLNYLGQGTAAAPTFPKGPPLLRKSVLLSLNDDILQELCLLYGAVADGEEEETGLPRKERICQDGWLQMLFDLRLLGCALFRKEHAALLVGTGEGEAAYAEAYQKILTNVDPIMCDEQLFEENCQMYLTRVNTILGLGLDAGKSKEAAHAALESIVECLPEGKPFPVPQVVPLWSM